MIRPRRSTLRLRTSAMWILSSFGSQITAVDPSGEMPMRYGMPSPVSVAATLQLFVSITLTVPAWFAPSHTVEPSGATATPSVARRHLQIAHECQLPEIDLADAAPADVRREECFPSAVTPSMCEPGCFVGIAAMSRRPCRDVHEHDVLRRFRCDDEPARRARQERRAVRPRVFAEVDRAARLSSRRDR